MEIKGKTAVVTGGASGLGLAFCRQLLKNGIQRVSILDINQSLGEKVAAELNEEFGKDRCIFRHCDVTNDSEFTECLKVSNEEFNGVDILINNAGIVQETCWQKTLDINLGSVIRGTMLALQHMGKDKGGRGGVIINVSSLAGLIPFYAAPVYSATKHGVLGFTRSMADPYYFNRTGVRMITLCPGFVTTDLVMKADSKQGDLNDEWKKIIKHTPKQSADTVAEQVAELIQNGSNGDVWFSDVEAGSYKYEFQMPKNVRIL